MLTDKEWHEWIASPEKSGQYYAVIVPFLVACYQRISQGILRFPQLTDKISNRCIADLIQSDFAPYLNYMVMRVCIYEYHEANQRGEFATEDLASNIQQFNQFLLAKDIQNQLFKKYSAMKKMMDEYVENYVTSILDFFKRLADDWHAIKIFFFTANGLLELRSITPCGDPHVDGNRVLLLQFSIHKKRMAKLIYKPRSMLVDVAFNHFILWINRYLATNALLPYGLLAKEGYGWVDYIEHTPCKTYAEVQLFYHRMGILMGMMYVLGGHDIHQENIIAHGAYPMIVDLECLFPPLLEKMHSFLNKAKRLTVLNSGILPTISLANDKFSGFDISALGGKGGEEVHYSALTPLSLAQGKLGIERQKIKINRSQNQPAYKNKIIDPAGFIDHLEQGFEACYRILARHKNTLLAKNSPLRGFKKARVRILFRATAEYAKLVSESFHPRLLLNKKNYSAHFSWLHAIAKFNAAFKSIIAAEHYDLTRLNVPIFYATTLGKSIFNSKNKPLNIQVDCSGWKMTCYLLRNKLTASDLYVQKYLIRNSFKLAEISRNPTQQSLTNKVLISKPAAQKTYQARAAKVIKCILDELSQLKIEYKNFISWPVADLKGSRIWCQEFADLDLYNGLSGIALSFAYGAILFPKKNYSAIALEIIHHIMTVVKRAKHQEIMPYPALQSPGFYSGIGGLLYVLTVFHHLFGVNIDETVKILAHALKKCIPSKNVDITLGTAGALIGLVQAKHRLNTSSFRKNLQRGIDNILSHQPTLQPFFAKPFSEEIDYPDLGLSHGVSGIRMALMAALQHTAYRKFECEQWISDSIQYEQFFFSKEHNNWPNLNKETPEYLHCSTAWCYGAPGIGLSKLNLLSCDTHGKAAMAAVEIALATTVKQGFGCYQKSTCLCHGELGNLDFLISLKQCKPDMLSDEVYFQHVDYMISKYEKYGVNADQEFGSASTGLMIGLAGAAYQMLRLENPERVPSILLPVDF